MAGKADLKRYVARRPFDYGRLSLDRGQVFELAGAPNDERLVRLGFVAQHDDSVTAICSVCGGEFIGESERRGHGDKQHSGRQLSPFEEDQRAEREERQLQQIAPLHLEKSAASLA